MIASGEARFWNEQPELPTELQWLIELFWTLSHFRPVSVGMVAVYGALPYAAVLDEAARHGLEGDDFEHFRACFLEMDRAYLKIVNRPKG